MTSVNSNPLPEMPQLDVYGKRFGSLHGKTVVITGGASGIGLECAKLFNSLGSKVVLGDIAPPRGEAARWLSQASEVTYVPCDITDWESVSSFFSTARSMTGRVDVVCANAGINETDNLWSGSGHDEGAKPPNLKTLKVNLEGAILTVYLAFQHLASSGGGSIIATCSMAGYLGLPEMPIYAAAKHGLVGLVRSLKPRAVPNNIAITMVAPGMTPTPIMASLPDVHMPKESSDEELAALYDRIRGSGIPANRTETVARAIAYLADSGVSVNGQSLMVMGDQVCELEEAIVESWPQWLLDATEFIRNAPTARVYDPDKGVNTR